jgi:uncharacterized secreted protein with C-terminal beta-propeller domain
MKRKNIKKFSIFLSGVIVIVSLAYAIDIQPLAIGRPNWYTTTSGLNNFSSYEELAEFLGENYNKLSSDYCCPYQLEDSATFSMEKSGRANNIVIDSSYNIDVDYSTTNVQVEGVDEPDIVKTDGSFLYILANSKLYIISVHPSEDADILSKLSFTDEEVFNFFLNKDRLIVFANSYRYPEKTDSEEDYFRYWDGLSTTIIKIFDISDRKNPSLDKDIEVDGYFIDSRMIGNYVYIITTQYLWDVYSVIDGNSSLNIPEIKIDKCVNNVLPNDIYFINSSEKVNSFTNIISINIFKGKVNQKTYLVGGSQNIYVSKNNIYLTNQEYKYYEKSSIFGLSIVNDYISRTVINKISIRNEDISHIAQGSVPGLILNQFSMDEHYNYFRIATTIGHVWNTEQKSTNNIYILDENLERVSEIEGIAPGETIYSARFMGNKAYLVTFKNIDPFFTIDLSDPENPKILGKLKIPGYSDYLHPYDENHIIGIGKDTVEPQEDNIWTENFAWYQGIKIALFDVSDFKNPKEISKVIIGDRGTDSPVLHNHKAFLFDREKELLVIPVKVCEISEEIKEQNKNYTGSIYGKFKFQGAYVYKLSLENGFELRGKITHLNDKIKENEDYWYRWSSPSYITRSLFIDNVLFTISDSMIKLNSLDDLSELNNILLK